MGGGGWREQPDSEKLRRPASSDQQISASVCTSSSGSLSYAERERARAGSTLHAASARRLLPPAVAGAPQPAASGQPEMSPPADKHRPPSSPPPPPPPPAFAGLPLTPGVLKVSVAPRTCQKTSDIFQANLSPFLPSFFFQPCFSWGFSLKYRDTYRDYPTRKPSTCERLLVDLWRFMPLHEINLYSARYSSPHTTLYIGNERATPDPASDLVRRWISPGRPVGYSKTRSFARAPRGEAVCPPAPGRARPLTPARPLPSYAWRGEPGRLAQSA